MNPVKLIISSGKNLEFKYGKLFPKINGLLRSLIKADKERQIDTKVIFIDDAKSSKSAGVKPVATVNMKACKKIVDELYKKYLPAYMVILGAQDVFPFQEITNPADDDDTTVPSDLPYACDAAYSKDIAAFTGPTRVVGRIPDIPGKQTSINYLKIVLENAIRHTPVKPDQYRKYFSVSAQVWKKSTALSLHSMFGDTGKLLLSPGNSSKYTATQLKAQTHFYNCHGAFNDPRYYGQKASAYPVALEATALDKKIASGTIVAAECCYGADLFEPALLDPPGLSIANTYLLNNAIAFVGSSNIAYGPADSQGLADLITQYFIISILNGASTGRAMLEARQRFLAASGPHLDPYELKTLAQFYLLGDPSLQPAYRDDQNNTKALAGNTTENNRINLFNKGVNLQRSISASEKLDGKIKSGNTRRLNEILNSTKFSNAEQQNVYLVQDKEKSGTGFAKKLTGQDTRFRTFIKSGKNKFLSDIKVLVVKENKEQILGWRIYESR